MRRTVSAALVAAGTVLAWAAPPAAADVTIPACAQTGPCVVAQVLDGTTQVGPLQYLYAEQVLAQGDIQQRTDYPVGGGNPAVVQRGSSIAHLISAAVPLDRVTFAEVVWSDLYQRHLLSGDEVRPGGFPGGLTPTFYSPDPPEGPTTYLSYVRPQRSADEANGAAGPDAGSTNTLANGSLLVRVHVSGTVLQVAATATPVDGSDRRYALSTDQTGPGLSFDWVLPGGAHSTEAAPEFTFADTDQAGSYPISVGVERADGSFGWGTVSVRAGAAPTAAPSPSATPTSSGGDGPADQGPTSNPSATLTADPNPAPTGSTGSSAPTSAPPATGPTGPAAPSATPSEAPTATPAPAPAGDEVTGVLLLAGQAAPVGGAQADAPRPSPGARPLGATPVTVPTAVLAALAALALLGLGAASESGRLRTVLRRRNR